MQQIADYLGVSKFVVSKALSGKPGVSASTRERVLQAAAQLGYLVNRSPYLTGSRLAAAAKNGRRKAVMVLMPNLRSQTRENPFWGRIVEGIATALEQHGLSMAIVSEQSEDIAHILNPESFLGWIGVGMIPTSVLLEAHRMNLPLVLIDHEDPLVPADKLFINNAECISRIVSHLIGLGHRSLRFVGDIDYSRSFYERWLGFRLAMEESGLSPANVGDMLHAPGNDRAEHRVSIKAWLQEQRADLPTALVCANDYIAVSALMVLEEMAVKAPEQVSVTGFDNIEDAYRVAPALTTVNVPKEILGRRAVETLLWRLQHPRDPFGKLLIDGELIIRDSIAGAPAGRGQ